MPPDPKPAMLLPRIKAIELGAAPQRAEPTSNNAIEVKKTALMLNKVYIFPNTSWKAQLVSRYAVPYQPISSAELNSLVIWGMAVEMMRRSCEWAWSVRKCFISICSWRSLLAWTHQGHEEHADKD